MVMLKLEMMVFLVLGVSSIMIFRRLLYLWFASYGAAWCWSWGIPSINLFKTWCPYYSVLRRQCLTVVSSFSTISTNRLLYCIFHETFPWSLLSHGLFYRLSQHTILPCICFFFSLMLELNRVACSKTWVFCLPEKISLFVVALFLSFSYFVKTKTLFTLFLLFVKQTNEKVS